MSITLALQYLRILDSADTNTFLMLAIGAEIRACEDGLRPEAETTVRIRQILDLGAALHDDAGQPPVVRLRSPPSPSPG